MPMMPGGWLGMGRVTLSFYDKWLGVGFDTRRLKHGHQVGGSVIELFS